MSQLEKIQVVYEKINGEFLLASPLGPTNNRNFREEFKETLEKEIPGSTVKCDEENNPPDVIESNCIVAWVSWVEDNSYKYCKLIFGQPDQVFKLHFKYYL